MSYLSFIGSGLPLGLDIFESGFWGGCFVQCLVLETGYLRLKPGFPQLHVMVADVIKSFDTVDRSVLDCALGRLGLPGWSRSLLLVWEILGVGMVVFTQGCPLSMVFIVALYVP